MKGTSKKKQKDTYGIVSRRKTAALTCRLRKGMVIGMKIVVLAGGTSTERDVSLSSGGMIYRALKKKGHKAILLDVYLGYEGETEGIFEGDTDWASQIGAIGEENPDLETVKALRTVSYTHLTLPTTPYV